MARYKLSTVAKEDLIRIYRYGYRTFGSNQANRYYDALFESFDRIASNPFSFEAVDYIRPGYRRCVYQSDTIYFRVVDNEFEIMTIIGTQDFLNSKWFFNKLLII